MVFLIFILIAFTFKWNFPASMLARKAAAALAAGCSIVGMKINEMYSFFFALFYLNLI
jgi:hypothetical protein